MHFKKNMHSYGIRTDDLMHTFCTSNHFHCEGEGIGPTSLYDMDYILISLHYQAASPCGWCRTSGAGTATVTTCRSWDTGPGPRMDSKISLMPRLAIKQGSEQQTQCDSGLQPD